MLDDRTEQMLKTANALTAEELDTLQATALMPDSYVGAETHETVEPDGAPSPGEPPVFENTEPVDKHAGVMPARPRRRKPENASVLSRGEYERRRTRESKVSTSCVGREREKHDWWPVGTELEGRIGTEVFTAVVVENTQVKSGRSIRITSGPATGQVCLTPTRAAIEATESYRQAHNLGRGGGVTNGWTFWQPKA